MYVSAETIAIIASVVGLVISLIGGFGWVVHRMDARFAELRSDMKAGDDRLWSAMTDLRSDMKTGHDQLWSAMTDLRSELKTDIAELRSELKDDIAELRSEMRSGDDRLRSEMRSGDDRLRSEAKAAEHALQAALGEVKDELTEIKIAIARLEGPRPQLALPR